MRIFAQILFILFAIQSFAQQEFFKSYSEKEGLDAKIIYAIEQVSQGQLLLSTEKGLRYFNGYEFSALKLPGFNEQSYISCISCFDNSCFFGSNKGEIWRQDPSGNVKQIERPAPFNSEIVSFHKKSNHLLAISKSTGILQFSERATKQFTLDENHPLVYHSIEINDTLLILGTGNGLFKLYSNQTGQFLTEKVFPSINMRINCLASHGNTIWAGTSGNGVFQLNTANNQIEKEFDEFENFNCSGIIARSKDHLWLSFFNAGVAKIEKSKVRIFNRKEELLTKRFNFVFLDKDLNVWFGSAGNGLFRKCNLPFQANTSYSGDISDIVKFENEYVTLRKEGLFSASRSVSLKNAQVVTTFNNELFFVSQGQLIGLKNNRKKIYAEDRLKLRFVKHLRADDKAIYICTSTDGFLIFDKEKGTFKEFDTQNGLTHNEVNFSFIDSKGKIWLAMSGAVLNTIEGDSAKIYDHSDGLHPFDFTQISEDMNGQIWVASDGGGIYSYQKNKFTNYAVSDGLHSNYITSISIDNENRIWASSGQTISLFTPQNKTFRQLKTKTEFYDFVINERGLKIIQDSILLLTDKGLFNYNAQNDIVPESSKLFFKKLTINDSIYDINSSISLPYGKYSMLVQFQRIAFDRQNEIKYKYFLDGQERDFGPAFAEPNCYYPGLLPGKQTLKVISSDGNGNWDKEPISMDFIIDRPFYQKAWFLLSSIFVLFAAFSTYTIWRERRSRQVQAYLNTELDARTAEVKEQRNQLIVKNKEIEDSILYAETIQKAMLPNPEWLFKNFKDHCLLYMPRDIVSGDFYWFADLGAHFLFAAADCTGHGVPGSMTSMICISELNKSVKMNKLLDPGEILTDVDKSLKKALQQNDEYSSMDGMDIGLCLFDKEQKELRFAGAGRPLYILQNGNLEEIRGSRNHIGGDGDDEKTFPVHTMPVSAGTRIYLSSDGYVDQFGGPRGKKFMRKRFRELILENENITLSQQKDMFKRTIHSWKKDLEQVDDILVLAVEF